MTVRTIDLLWPAVVAILLAICSAVMSTEYDSWWSVAAMSGPQAILYALVERLNNGPSYWGPFRQSYEEILTKTDDRLWGSDVSPELVKELHGPRVGALHVGVTRSTARNNAIVSLALLALLAWLTFLWAAKQWCQSRAKGSKIPEPEL
jgi:hypothetical protein